MNKEIEEIERGNIVAKMLLSTANVVVDVAPRRANRNIKSFKPFGEILDLLTKYLLY
jgi:hypothetical protein